MKVNPFMIALQVLEAVTAVSELSPGDSDILPALHVSSKGEHISITITVSRDAIPIASPTHLPISKG